MKSTDMWGSDGSRDPREGNDFEKVIQTQDTC